MGVKIENIVCSGTFNQPLDLRQLADDCEFIEYGLNKYPGGYIKFDGHSVTIYRTGKYIMPGMRSFEDVENTFSKVKEILAPYTDVSLFGKPGIRNMVCSSTVNTEINLAELYVELISSDMDAIYEPEAFPGLILKTEDCTYNIFQSGKFLILGCTSKLQAENAEQYFLNLVKN